MIKNVLDLDYLVHIICVYARNNTGNVNDICEHEAQTCKTKKKTNRIRVREDNHSPQEDAPEAPEVAVAAREAAAEDLAEAEESVAVTVPAVVKVAAVAEKAVAGVRDNKKRPCLIKQVGAFLFLPKGILNYSDFHTRPRHGDKISRRPY